MVLIDRASCYWLYSGESSLSLYSCMSLQCENRTAYLFDEMHIPPMEINRSLNFAKHCKLHQALSCITEFPKQPIDKGFSAKLR